MTKKWLRDLFSKWARQGRRTAKPRRADLRLEPLEHRTVPAVSYTTIGSTYTQNFNGLPSTGTFDVSSSGTNVVALDDAPISATGMGNDDWVFQRVAGDATRFAVDNGSSNTGSVYSYGATGSTDRALGLLASSTNTSGIGVVLQNNTGGALNSVTVTFTGEQWRRGAGTDNTLAFSYGAGADPLALTYTNFEFLSFTSPNTAVGAGSIDKSLDGNAPENRTTHTATFPVTWANGQFLVLRWLDRDDVNNDDGLAIDDFSFSARNTLDVLGPTAVGITEGNTGATTVQVSNPGGAAVAYSIVGGADKNLFAVGGTSGVLTFKAQPFTTAPADANGDNVYEVTVRATAGAQTDDLPYSVRVLPLEFTPTAGAVGVNDTYQTAFGTALTRPAATGVLANDRLGADDRVTLLGEGFQGIRLRPYETTSATAQDNTDWATSLPPGWTATVLATTPVGANGEGREFYGWRVHDIDSWVSQQGNQNRTDFTKGGVGARGQILMADGDAYDDFVSIGGGDPIGRADALNTTVNFPPVSATGLKANSVKLEFDSSFRPEDPGATQQGLVQYSLDGGTNWVTLLTLLNQDERNATYSLDIPNGTTGDVRVRLNYQAGNDWWWAIDNVRVTGLKTETSGASVLDAPDNGMLTLNADGSFTYTPNADFSGVDTFVYRPTATGSMAKVSVQVQNAADFYVDDAWAGFTAGQAIPDLDPTRPGNQPGVFGTDGFAKINAAVAASVDGKKIAVNAGTYPEAAVVNKAVEITFQEGNSTVNSLDDTVTGASIKLNPGIVLTVGDAANTSVDSPVSGAGSIVKQGSGKLALAGANTYTGTTTVNGGTLLANNATGSATGTGAVTVAAGATFGGTGAVTGAVTANGTLAVGEVATAAADLATGDVAFGADGMFAVDLLGGAPGTGYDQLVVTGAVNLTGAALSVNTGSFTPGLGDVYTLIANDKTEAITGTFDGLAEGATVTVGSNTYRISYVGGTGNDVTLTRFTTLNYATPGAVYTQNFNNLFTTVPADGTAVATGSLAEPVWTGWSIAEGGADANALVQVHSGGGATGDTYLFGAAGSNERALGSIASGTNVPRFGAVFTNTTGQTLTSFTLAYTAEQWRRGSNPSGGVFEFAYGLGTAALTGGTFTNVVELNATTSNLAATVDTATDGNAAANRRTVSYTVGGLTWAPGTTLAIRWSDIDSAGTDDGLAIDDLTFSASGSVLAITSNGGGDKAAVSIPEASTGVTTVTSTALASGAARTFSIAGGADAKLFDINPTTGALALRAPAFFSQPADANDNNVYEVTVQVAAGAATDTQALSVTVVNTSGAPAGVNDKYTFTPNAKLDVPTATGVTANDKLAAADRVTLLSEGFEGLAPRLRPYQSPGEGGTVTAGTTTYASDGTDWTDALPAGWSMVLSPTTPVGNPIEFQGWRVHDATSWVATEGNQNRNAFTRGGVDTRGTVLVVDGDAYDDGIEIDPSQLNATINLPAIPLAGVAAGSAKLEFDTSYRAETDQATQTGRVEYSLNGGTTWVTLQAFDNVTSFLDDRLVFNIPNGTTGDLRVRFVYQGGNDWWWALDNVSVTATRTEAAAAVVAGPANGSVVLNGNGSFTYTPNAGFSGTDSFVYRPTPSGNLTKVTLNAAVSAPQVTGVLVNGTTTPSASVTSSRATSVVVLFNTAVSAVDPAAFTLLNTTTGTTLTNGAGVTVSGLGTAALTLTFTGATGVEFGSLADGVWRLTTDLTKVRNTSSTAGTGSAVTENIRRLFGDANGDGTVNLEDYEQFGNAFGGVDPRFDHNGDGVVNLEDYEQFGNRFGTTL